MVDTVHRLGIPMMADSSIPFSWRLPELELPLGCEIEDCLMVGCGDLDAHGFHALAAMQSLVERRAGGETGVTSVQALRGAELWAAGRAGVFDEALLEAALSCSDEINFGKTLEDARPQDLVRSGELARLTAAREDGTLPDAFDVAAYFVQVDLSAAEVEDRKE